MSTTTNTATTKGSTIATTEGVIVAEQRHVTAKPAAAKAKATPAAKAAPATSAPEPTQTAKKATRTHASRAAAVKAAESAQADVAFYRQRKTGTLRRLPYLAPGSPERKAADKVAAQFAKGTSVVTIADASGRSRSTVRRMLAAVELAAEIESGKYAKQIKTGKVILPAKGDDK